MNSAPVSGKAVARADQFSVTTVMPGLTTAGMARRTGLCPALRTKVMLVP